MTVVQVIITALAITQTCVVVAICVIVPADVEIPGVCITTQHRAERPCGKVYGAAGIVDQCDDSVTDRVLRVAGAINDLGRSQS